MGKRALIGISNLTVALLAVTDDAGQWLETKMVPEGWQRRDIPLCGRLLGGERAGEMGWMS